MDSLSIMLDKSTKSLHDAPDSGENNLKRSQMFSGGIRNNACLDPVVHPLVFQFSPADLHHALFKAALPCHELRIYEHEFRKKKLMESYLQHADAAQYLSKAPVK
jgi:hypothetical protein